MAESGIGEPSEYPSRIVAGARVKEFSCIQRDQVKGEREKLWEGYAAVARFSGSGGEWVNPRCQRWKSPARSSLSTRVRT